MLKKKIACLMLLTAIVSCVCPVYASDVYDDVVVSLQIGNPLMQVNGEDTEIDEGRGTTPVIVNGYTLVPLRAIIEKFGGTVGWEDKTKTVILSMGADVIQLVIDSDKSQFNGEEYTLDVAPAVINGRTMLPIRFVAECFNFGVAWNGNNKVVTIIRDTLNEQEYQYIKAIVPEYSGNAYIEVNSNIPMFKDYEIIDAPLEYYSSLDGLGRCDVCIASVSGDTMPTEDRGDISSVLPTGFVNCEYDGSYLYNRCHLIGFQLTGENDNPRNLITGTRSMNVKGMLPFENKIDDYIEETGNRVMYRVTPVFTQENLVADGVLLEAYSVEDKGEGVSFCVYCYNVEPDVEIDYKTGNSSIKAEEALKENMGDKIYCTPTGKRYHIDKECGGKNSHEITMEYAEELGLTPCQKCTK